MARIADVEEAQMDGELFNVPTSSFDDPPADGMHCGVALEQEWLTWAEKDRPKGGYTIDMTMWVCPKCWRRWITSCT